MNQDVTKYTLKTVLLILALSFVVDKVVFFGFNKISDKVFTGQSIGKLNQYLQLKDGVDFIVYGSSRANHNVDPVKISESSFNMGKDGMKLGYAATLIKLLDNNKKQTILLHIDSENAFDQDYNGADIQALTSKYNRNSIIKEEIDELNQNNILQNYYWSIGYNGKALGIIKNYLKPNYNYKTYSGYDPIYVSENQRKIFKEIIKNDKKAEDCLKAYELNNIYSDCIDKLSEFCSNKNLIIFTSPKFDDNCKDDNQKLSQLLADRGLNYYDLTDFFKDNNNFEYWKDKTHLSNKGAELFTVRIKELITGYNK